MRNETPKRNASHIRNPLTIIAIFASVAEICGTGILPFLDQQNQNVYVWFLMLFPSALVILFFITLNFNHHALYAPSDFKNEDNYFKAIQSASPKESADKLSQEVKEIESEDLITSQHLDGVGKADLQRDDFNRVVSAEKLVLWKLEKGFGANLLKEVRMGFTTGRTLTLDGYVSDTTSPVIVEVKYSKTLSDFSRRIDGLLRTFFPTITRAVEDGDIPKTLTVVVAIATDAETYDPHWFDAALKQKTEKLPYTVALQIFKMSDLLAEFSNAA